MPVRKSAIFATFSIASNACAACAKGIFNAENSFYGRREDILALARLLRIRLAGSKAKKRLRWRKTGSVIQRVFKLKKLFRPYCLADPGGEFLELVEIASRLHGQVEPETAQAQASRQARGNGIGL